MSEQRFTEKQLAAIDKNNKSLLVSAAAGSGKTTVLVERVCRILSDQSHPVSPDEILVVTFTNAAAGEMKERISNRLRKLSESSSDNKYLKKQLLLLQQGNISTIDSFCRKLVREFFYVADIDIDFKYATPADESEISDTAMMNAIEWFYNEYTDKAITLSKALNGDENLKKLIKKTYSYVFSLPFPDDFFNLALKNYDISKNGENYYLDRLPQEEREAAKPSIPIIKEQLELFISATRSYMDFLNKIKKEKGIYTFSDVEHIALNLLCVKEDGKEKITEIGENLSKKFAYILVDEYQDTNELQDKIFRILSNDGANLFAVGDSKQSIYGFRQANPEIFIKHKNDGTEGKNVINLAANFRSEKYICDTINSIFSTFGDDITGGIDYKSEELISKGSYPDENSEKVEFQIIDKNGEELDLAEADFAARWINEKIKSGYEIFDIKQNQKRPIKYSDIAIFLRSAKSHGNAYKEVLKKHKIPSFFSGGENAYNSLEVRIMMDLLKAINNPLYDISLFSALMSPFFNMTADDMVKIKLPKKSLYASLIISAENGFEKAKEALVTLTDLKNKSNYMPLEFFIENIYLSTGYYAITGGMPEGKLKQSNLHRLVTAAEDYSKNSGATLGGFIRYMENLQKNDSSSGGSINDKENLVRIMSAHSSKGLEFPICFVAGTDRRGVADYDPLIIHGKSGMGLYYYLPEFEARYNNKPFELIKDDISRDDMAEELRILYVEITRAKNKLIILSTRDNPSEHFKKLDKELEEYTQGDNTKPLSFKLLQKKRISDIIYMASKQSNADILIKENVYIPSEISEVPDAEEPIDEVLLKKLKENFNSSMTVKENLPSKITASALNRKNSKNSYSFKTQPAFMSPGGLTPAQKGTALHTFMQYCNFNFAFENPQEEAERLLNNGFISEEEKNAIDFEKIKSFFNSDLFKRISKSEQVYREKQFTVLVKASEILDTAENTEIVVQGICDLAFTENDALIITDYKTDTCDNAKQLFEKYKSQLLLYSKCLEKALGIKTCKIGIYSFNKSELYEEDV